MITVYSIPGSPYGRAVIAAAIEKGAPYRLSALSPGESKGPPHLARQPFGKIPAIDHDGFALYEVQAINRYIDQAFEGPALVPTEARAAARMSQVMNITDWYVFRWISAEIGFNRVIAPKFGLPVDEAAVAAAIPDARKTVAVLEGLLGDAPFMAGEAFSLADLHLAPQIEMFGECAEGAEMLAGAPRLSGWVRRIGQRPSFQATTWERLAQAA